MFKNFIKLTWRHFISNPFFSFINIFGLSLGMTAALLILLLVIHEKSYDKFHINAENIYRIGLDYTQGNTEFNFAICMTPLGPELQRVYPEVLSYTRISIPRTSTLFAFGNEKFYEDGFYYADSGFFKTFSFKLIQGDHDNVLAQPYSLVLSKETAVKYFGAEDPVGKVLKMNNEDNFTITGIVENSPSNSHFQFSILGSFSTLYQGSRAQYMDNWLGNINYWTYLRVSDGTKSLDLANMATESIERNAGNDLQESDRSVIPRIQNITDIYLGSDRMGEIGVTSSNEYVNIFLAVAIFILAIASINYINLSTARSSSRAKEVGLKKVVGAVRQALIRQFLSETLVFTFISLSIALILVELLLPPFNNLMGKQLEFSLLGDPGMTIFFVIVAFIVGIISGTYPAFYLSSFMPLKVIKGELFSGLKNNSLRNLLVITQFTLAVVLIIGSIMIMRQVNYIQNKDLGYNKDHIVILPLRSDETRNNYQTIKEDLIKLPFVSQISASQNFPGKIFSGNGYKFEGLESTAELIMNSIDIDEDFIPLYQMKIVAGRNFSSDFSTDDKALIINETNSKFLGLENPIGTQVVFNGVPGYTIVGIVDDFNFASLHNKIEPLVISCRPNRFMYLNIKIQAANLTSNLNTLEREWEKIDPDRPFDYFFLDPTFEQLYENEKRILGLLTYFTLLTIIIALLGLYGLSSFLMLKRTKEIGIRKALGATGSNISKMFIRDFLILVMIANIIALPASFFSIRKWLQNFEYHTNIGVWIFFLAIVLSILIAFLTVLYHSLRASRTNPAESIRYE